MDSGGEQDDPAGRQGHPHEVAGPPRRGDRNSERPRELERHRDPQRDPVERSVEAEVHARQHDPEQDGVAQRPAGGPRHMRAPDRRQDHGGEAGAEGTVPDGPARRTASSPPRRPPADARCHHQAEGCRAPRRSRRPSLNECLTGRRKGRWAACGCGPGPVAIRSSVPRRALGRASGSPTPLAGAFQLLIALPRHAPHHSHLRLRLVELSCRCSRDSSASCGSARGVGPLAQDGSARRRSAGRGAQLDDGNNDGHREAPTPGVA